MPKPATHILVHYPSKGMDLLYRAADGMALACRTQLTVIAGEDPNPQKMESRNFLDQKFAEMYLRTLADRDSQALFGLNYAASIEEREGESRIVSAGSSLRN